MHIAIWKQQGQDNEYLDKNGVRVSSFKEHLSMVTFLDKEDLEKRLFSGELPKLPDNIIVTNSDGLVIREYVIGLEEIDIQ